MAPPSSTTRAGLPAIGAIGCHWRMPSRFTMRSFAASSRLWFAYFAQPLKRQLVIATSPARLPTKSGQ